MNTVEDFMAQLAAQTATINKTNDFKAKSRVLEKISLNYEGNFGRYQIFPMDSVVTNYPFVTLFNTREICMPRKNINSDGVETSYNAWIKILPKEGYRMKDSTGRIVSSLTAQDEEMLNTASRLFDEIYTEIDAKNNLQLSRDILRKRNYTIFHGYCLNKWGLEDMRTPAKTNFSGLFVSTAKGFVQAVQDNLTERSIINGGDNSFVKSIYTNSLTNRDGYLLFSINRSKTSAGYTVTVTHESGHAAALAGVSIPAEDAELMKDPVETFLGWQANRADEAEPGYKRLFNPALIKEAIDFMTGVLANIRMAKQSGTDIAEAIKKTNETALANSVPTNTMGKATNDPILAQMTQNSQSNINPETIIANNTQPFQTPPVSHIDPVTSSPVGNDSASGFGGFNFGNQNVTGTETNAAPFTQPAFGQFNNAPTNDLPF